MQLFTMLNSLKQGLIFSSIFETSLFNPVCQALVLIVALSYPDGFYDTFSENIIVDFCVCLAAVCCAIQPHYAIKCISAF